MADWRPRPTKAAVGHGNVRLSKMLFYTVLSSTFEAISDLISDEVVGDDGDDDADDDADDRLDGDDDGDTFTDHYSREMLHHNQTLLHHRSNSPSKMLENREMQVGFESQREGASMTASVAGKQRAHIDHGIDYRPEPRAVAATPTLRVSNKLSGEQDFIVSTTMSLCVSFYLSVRDPGSAMSAEASDEPSAEATAAGGGGFFPPAHLLGTQFAIVAGLFWAVGSIFLMKVLPF